MAPRALGALFALVAALAFATAFVGGLAPTAIPGWWDGHPTVQGKQIERKSIHVGLLGAIGCNHGGETTCEPLETGHALDVVGFAELAALGLGFVTALLTAFSVWKLGDRRKFLGKLLLFEVLLVAGGASAVFFHGPDLHVSVQVGMPVGLGFMSVAAGSLLAFVGSLIAMRVEPEPLRLKRSEQRIPTPHQQQPAFDVRELLHDNQQPGMRVTHPHMMPPSPGGPLPGPGPLGGPMGPPPQQHPHPINPAPGHQPLFESAPHLRPLYDMQNAGAAPNPVPPQMPTRAPTPVSRDAVGDRLGIPTQMPPPLQEPPTPHYGGDPGYNAGDSASMHAPISPARSIEMTEDIPRESAPELGPSPLDPPRSTSSQYERPSAQYIEAPTTPRRGNDAARKAAAAAMPMPPRPRPSVPPPRPTGPKTSTIAVAVAPMPGVGVAEQSTSVEIDAEAKAAARLERERPSEQAMTRPVERTDESVIAPPPPLPHDDATNQTRVPESFEELQTRDANQRFEAGVANTELAPSIEEPPRAATQPFGSQEPRDDDDESTSFGSKPEPAIAAVEPDHDQPIEPPTYAVRSRPETNGDGPTNHHVPMKAPVMVSDHEAPTNHERKKPLEPKVDTSDETMDVVKVEPPSPPPPRAPLPPPRPASLPQRATPLPSALRTTSPTSPPPPNPNPPAPTSPSAESGVPSSPFPVAPSAAAFAPPKPLPRPAKPSVPPPAAGSKFPPFVPKPVIPIPSMVPSNGIGKPPSNLEPTATANKSSTTSTTPSPFATIPSPFGPKPAAPSTDEAVTRAARANAATDPVTAPERPSEAPTRAIPKTDPEPDVVAEPPRAKWRASSESPTSHVASEDFADAAQRDQKAVVAKKAAIDQAVHEERTVQSRGAGRDDLPQNASGEISSKRPGDASTKSSRASGVHESPTAHADVKLPSGPRRTTPRAQTPEEVRVISTAPSTLPPPKKVPTASSGPTPACPQCEAPMAWVEEHLRFYCASCRMYF